MELRIILEKLKMESELSTTKSGLLKLGFTGFKSIESLQAVKANGDNIGCSHLPRKHGVYAVVYTNESEPQFIEDPSPQIKARTYPVSCLREKWIRNVEVLNFGKAESKRNGLRGRVRQYVRFGLGEVDNHKGGRSIWQLKGASDLEIGYLITENLRLSARELECIMVTSFRQSTGRTPFAWRENS